MNSLATRTRGLLLIGAFLLIGWIAYPAVASAPATYDPLALKGPSSLPLTGSVTFTASVDPAASGPISSVTFEERAAGAQGAWTPFPDPSSGTLDTTTLPGDGNYDIRAVASEGAHTVYSQVLRDQTVTNSSIYISLSSPGSPLSGSATLVAEPVVGGAQPDTVTFTACPATADCSSPANWHAVATAGPKTDSGGTPVTDPITGAGIYSATFDSTNLADGTYNISVTGAAAGGSDHFQGGEVSGVVVDNTRPGVSLRDPGGQLTGTAILRADTTDSGSGIASVRFELSPAGSGEWSTAGVAASSPYSVDLDTRQFTDGSYDLRAIATDLAGNSTTSSVISALQIANPGSSGFGGLTVTSIDVPATNVTLVGELPGSEHETWALGQTNAPPPTVDGQTLPYTAQGNGQLVVLRYTSDTGWQIMDVLRDGNGNAYALQPGTQDRISGAMAPNGEAWLALTQVQTTPFKVYPTEIFHRSPGGQLRLDADATSTLAPVLVGTVSIRLGENSSGVYGALFPGGAESTTQPVWTPQGEANMQVSLQYGQLDGGHWSLAGASLPAGYMAPSDAVSQIKLDAGDVTGPDSGWGAIEMVGKGPSGGNESSTVLAKFGPGGWDFLPSTGLDALDSSGRFSDDSSQSAAAGAGASVAPTALQADTQGGFLSASVKQGTGGNGTVIARFDSTGKVLDSWCSSSLPQTSYGCAHPLDVDHPAIVPGSLFSTSDGEYGIGLGSTAGSLSVYTDGSWQTVPAQGFRAGASVSSVFAGPSDGWISGANTLGLVSATPPPQPLASWPEANRDPLVSVALPPGSTTATAGALAVGLSGTALHYDPSSGWQVDGTPDRTSHLALTGVAFAQSKLAFAVGQAGTILRWNGSDWSADPQSNQLTTETLNAIAFGSDGQGWAVGGFGTILHYDGTAWSTETVDSADAGADITSVAVAGRDVFAIAGGNLIERTSAGGWERVPTGVLPKPLPAPGSLELVSGLPDGGLVIAGKSLLITRNSATGALAYAPETINGIPVALAAFRSPSGDVRAFVSVAPPIDSTQGTGSSDSTGGFPAGDGDLLVQTDGGWRDLSEDTPPTSVSAPAGDGTIHPDPVLAVASSSDGSHAWAVGGYAGTHAADGVGTDQVLQARSQSWYSSAIWRYDASGSVSSSASGQATVQLPATAGTVGFAFFSSALCRDECAAVHDAQPDVNLESAATQIAAYAQQPGGPAFAMFGGNARGPINAASYQDGNGAIDFAHLPSLLAPLSGLPTYAAYGPLDAVPGQTDPSAPWAQAFATSPAPFGSGSVPAGITPQGSGDPSGSVHKYYAFDVSQNGGTVRAIVLDNSQGSLESSAPGQSSWLADELAQAQAANLPVVVFAAEPLNSLIVGAASDADSVAAQLANAGVLAVFTTAGGTTPDGTDSNQPDRVSQIPADAGSGDLQIPEYEGATMTYQQNTNNGVLWYDVSVNTQNKAVTVNAVPVISSLALDPKKGLTAARSSTLLFQAIGRRPQATIATSPGNPTFPGYSQYVNIPASACTGCITPTYSFQSSDPIVGNFVAANGSTPKLTEGKTTPSSTSGLFCAFNAGTTTVTVTAGLMSESLPVTVKAGAFGPPCGTVPGGVNTNVIQIKGATNYSTAASPQGGAPVRPQVTPSQQTPLPKVNVPPAPGKVSAPPPPHQAHHVPVPRPSHHTVPQPQQQQPFILAPSPLSTIGASLAAPVPPPLTPVPPGGATAQAQSTAKREEKAKKEASQSAFVTRPAGQSDVEWFYPAVGVMTLVSLLLISGGIKPGPKRAPAYALVRQDNERRRRHG